jgi:hypothetical protein
VRHGFATFPTQRQTGARPSDPHEMLPYGAIGPAWRARGRQVLRKNSIFTPASSITS